MNNEKTERNIKIVKLRDETGLTFARIAEGLGISRQMVHKVYNNTKKKLVRED